MNTEFTNIAGNILDSIKQSKKILLHCHPFPDPDSIGSVLSMEAVLTKMGKEVTCIIGDSQYPEYLTSLPNHDRIQLKNYSEIDPKEFNLFIILDSSSLTQISQKKEVIFPDTLKTIVIDHHKTNSQFGNINFVDSGSSSTSEILFKLFDAWGIEIDRNIAICLLLGIFADTGGFRYPNATPETLHIVSELSAIYPDYHKFVFDLENNKKPIELEMLGLALSNIHEYYSSQVVFSVISNEDLRSRNISKEDSMEGLIGNTLRSVSGWTLVESLVEAEPDIVTVSLRTRDEKRYDVSKIAKSIGENGGGHTGAAGTTIHKPLGEAITSLLGVISEFYPELK